VIVVDEQLLERWVVHGDADAFQALVGRHASMVFNTCRRILRNDTDAEDVAQECFETLAGLTSSVRVRGVGAWLHGTATRKALMHVRGEGRRAKREAAYAEARPSSAETTWNDVYDAVDEAIAQLPDDLRAPVVQHYLYGQSHGDIARETGTPRRTVSNRIRKGLERIGEDLRARGISTTGAALGVLFTARLAEAAPLPASLQVSLGKLTLSCAAQGAGTVGAGIAVGNAAVVAGMFAVKKVVVVLILVVVGGLGVWALKESLPEQPVEVAEQAIETDNVDVMEPTESPSLVSPVDELEVPSEPSTTAEAPPGIDVIHGRVVDAETGVPLALDVVLTGEVAYGEDTTVRAGADGTFRFDEPELGYGTFTVSCRNEAIWPFPEVSGVRIRGKATPVVEIRVKGLATISGRVLLADGTPAANAALMRRQLDGNSDTWRQADADGAYRIHHDGGKWQLWVSKGLLRSPEVTFDLQAGESVAHDFVLPEFGEITITLEPRDGGRVTGITNSVVMTDALTAPYLLAESSEANVFVARHMPFDTYHLEIRAEGYAPTLVEDIVVGPKQRSPSVTVRLEPVELYSLTVRVIDGTGDPVPEAGVVLYHVTEALDADGAVQAEVEQSTRHNGENTDAGGYWTIEGLRAGRYRVHCSDEAGTGTTFVTVPNDEEVVLRLSKTLGRIDFELEAYSEGQSLSPTDIQTFVVHPDGTLDDVLVAGSNWIVAVKAGYTAFIEEVSAAPSTSGEPVVVEAHMDEGGDIAGQIEGAVGRLTYVHVYPAELWALAHANWDAWKRMGRVLAQDARTDAGGGFVLSNLPQGAYVIALDAETYSEPVAVLPGNTSEVVVVRRD
jgi:RNA polymerase sigma factor (sigma-70 family)